MTRAGKEASGGGQLSWPDLSSWAAPRALVEAHKEMSPFHNRAFAESNKGGIPARLLCWRQAGGPPAAPEGPQPTSPGGAWPPQGQESHAAGT